MAHHNRLAADWRLPFDVVSTPEPGGSIVEAVEITSKGSFVFQKRLGFDFQINDDLGHWLAGFVDGEGAFMIHPVIRKRGYIRKDGSSQESHECDVKFQIKLRVDDIQILQEIKKHLACGKVIVCQRSKSKGGFENTKPVAIYLVTVYSDLYNIIVPLFEKYPLRAKKAQDFEIWKDAVAIAYQAKLSSRSMKLRQRALSDSQWSSFVEIAERLRKTREFDESHLESYLETVPKSQWDPSLRERYNDTK